jgi:ankyrin repeat protein
MASFSHLIQITFSNLRYSQTPLHSAIILSKSYDTCRVLLEHGANLWKRNAEGQTPLHTPPNQVSNQILHCYGSLLDVSACGDDGMPLLHYMAWSSKTSLKIFWRYHKHGDVGLEMVDVEGTSLLHLAAQRGNVPVIEYLLDLDQDNNTKLRDRRVRTVLHYKVENKRAPQTLAVLVSHGSDPLGS